MMKQKVIPGKAEDSSESSTFLIVSFIEEATVKALVTSTLLLLCILGYSEIVLAQEEVRVRPIDLYISGFVGYSHPFKTEFSSAGVTAQDAELEQSPSVGGKIGIWITAPRKFLGIDLGAEIDITSFGPNLPGGQVLQSNVGLVSPIALDFSAVYLGISILARLPLGVTAELPNGRWFPYIGFGGGGQRLTFQTVGTNEGQHTAPAFQGLGGAKVFVTKHIAAFVEGKYIHASHTLEAQGGPPAELTVNSVHGVGGLSFHF